MRSSSEGQKDETASILVKYNATADADRSNSMHVSLSPITCAFATADDFDYNYSGGIYIDHSNATDSNHDVEVVGWGVDESTGMKYWIARNSCQWREGGGAAEGWKWHASV
jgi:hypothetical protein